MPRLPKRARTAPAVVLVALLVALLGAGLTACGSSAGPHADVKAKRALEQCRDQWRDVGDTVVGMDEDQNPSALSNRWTTVIATVDYYRTADKVEDCQATIDTQLKAVTALRQFSEKLRPYDMTYQLGQVRAAIDLYLNDPLPAPVRNQNGKRVAPPSKAAVTAAMKTLSQNAADANAELEPGWAQTSSVDLTDVAALGRTMQDLDFLAQDSPHWRACEQALQVLIAAIRAQEGLSGSPGAPSGPTSGPTDATSP